jgi:hypothetical protein
MKFVTVFGTSNALAASCQLILTTRNYTMVTLNDAFPSKYLKATDLAEPVVATIKLAELEHIKGFDGKEQAKVVLYFAKKLKPLPLNRTNFESVGDICGSYDSDDFTGTKIELYATKTSMNGKVMDCVRIRAPGVTEKRKKPAKSDSTEKPSLRDEMNDEIPL